MKHSVLAILASLTLAAPLVARADAPLDPKVDAIAEKSVKMIERMAADVDANKPDCDKIGAALNKHADEDAATLKEAKAVDAGKTKTQKDAEKKALDAKYGDRIKAAMGKLAPMKACKANASVKAYGKKVGM